MSKQKDMNLFIPFLSWTVKETRKAIHLNVMYVGKDSRNHPIEIDTMKLFIISKRITSVIFVQKFLEEQTILKDINKFMKVRTANEHSCSFISSHISPITETGVLGLHDETRDGSVVHER